MRLLVLLSMLFSFPVLAANVLSAKMDSSRENILVDVVYGGGCAEHKFSLKMGFCSQGAEYRNCTAYLIEEIEGGVDNCQAIKHETAVINIEKNNLEDYRESHITILGDRSFNGTQTAVSVWLPLKD